MMFDVDLNAPAILRWISREVPRERAFLSLKEAVRVAMTELRKAEFLSAHISSGGHDLAGDLVVELFQTGALARRGYARF